MATDLGRTKPAAGAKHETFLNDQLTRTRRKIRTLDVAAAGLGLLIGVLAYGLVIALLDRSLEGLPSLVRLAAFGCFTAFVLGYVTLVLVLPFFRRVNPYFAARELERTVPGAKNSVINWLDLRDEKLPPAIRQAVSRRAARDLARADMDRAVTKRRVVWTAAGAGGLVLALFLLFLFSPGQFWSLMSRAFAPFLEASMASQTGLAVIQPEGGNTTVAVNHPLTITVRVTGRTPPEANWKGPIALDVRTDADGLIRGYRNVPADVNPNVLMLHLRYAEKDPYTQFAFEHDVDNDWKVTLPANRVLNGFSYRVTGNDAQTDEYRVKVTSTPLVNEFQVTYDHPEWARLKQTTSNDPNLKAVRDSKVALVVRTNRPLKEGYLDVEAGPEKKTLEGTLLPNDPEAMSFQFPLKLSGGYRVRFTSTTGERYDEPIRYTIDVDPASEVTFAYRPYLKHEDQTFMVPHLPSLTALRGTKVRINYLANQPVDKGDLVVRVGKEKPYSLAGKTDPRKPESLRFEGLVIDRNGTYQLVYTNKRGQVIKDPVLYPIKALPDLLPRVELTKPGKDVSLPANGMLHLEGAANDDFGITHLTLKMFVHDGNTDVPLESKVYRDGKVLKTGKARYPLRLDYKDFVELAKVRPGDRTPFTLRPGMVLTYWLEATDNCDYPEPAKGQPRGQVGKSKAYKVTILPPEKDQQKQEQQKEQAEKEQKQHEKKQDDQLRNQQDQPKPPSENPEKQPPQNKPDKGDKSSGKDPEKNKKPEKKDPGKEQGNDKKSGNSGQKPDKKPNEKTRGQGDDAGNKEQDKEKQELDKTGNKLKEELNNSKKKDQPERKEDPSKKEGPQGKDPKQSEPKEGPKGKDPMKSEPKEGPKGKDPMKSEPKEGPKGKDPMKSEPKEGPKGKDPMKAEPKEGPKGKDPIKSEPKEGPKGKDPMKAEPKEGPKGKDPMKADPKEGPKGKDPKKAEPKEGPKGKDPMKAEPKEGPKGKDPIKSEPKEGPKGKDPMKAEPKEGPKGKDPMKSEPKEGPEGKDPKKAEPKEGSKGKDPMKAEPKEGPKGKDPKKSEPKEGPKGKDPMKSEPKEGPKGKDPMKADPKEGPKGKDPKKAEPKEGPKGKDPMKAEPKEGPQGKDPIKSEPKEGPKGKDPMKSEPKEGPKGKDPMKGEPNNKNKPPEQDPMNKGKKEDPNSKGRGKGVNGNQQTGNHGDDVPPPKGKPADPDSAKKAADLSLENLRDRLKKMSPEERRQLLKKANVSEKEFEAWDKKVENYEKKWKKPGKLSDPRKGGRGSLKNTGPKKVDGGNKSDAIESGRGTPPPEYKDLFERYTRQKVSD